MKFSPRLVDVLMSGIAPQRVLHRVGGGGKQLSYLTQADVRAHLIRMFGFGGFSISVKEVETLFDEFNEDRRWHVGVRAIVRLTIHDPVQDSFEDVSYEDAAVAESTQPQHGEALDMATKSAVSDAVKRAAVNLGDQFGLSLYFNGRTAPVVRQLVEPPETTEGGPVEPGQEIEVPTPVEGEFVANE
jgi:recombination DNA repair RAD52 pathway protein